MSMLDDADTITAGTITAGTISAASDAPPVVDHADDRPSVAPVAIGATVVSEVVEYVTHMMGREVWCRWSDGAVEGDPELMERLAHLEAFDVDYSTPLSTLTTLRRVLLDPIIVRFASS